MIRLSCVPQLHVFGANSRSLVKVVDASIHPLLRRHERALRMPLMMFFFVILSYEGELAKRSDSAFGSSFDLTDYAISQK